MVRLLRRIPPAAHGDDRGAGVPLDYSPEQPQVRLELPGPRLCRLGGRGESVPDVQPRPLDLGVVGATEEDELVALVLELHHPPDLGVARRERLDGAVVEHGLVQVVRVADGALAGEHLGDEALLALHGLVQVAVEGACRDVAEVSDVGVLVALADDAAKPLLEVGRPPRAVEVVRGHEVGLDVDPGPERLRRTDEHADVAGVHSGVEGVAPLLAVARLPHRRHLRLRDAEGHDRVPEGVDDVPPAGPARRRRRVAEDELRTPGPGGLLPYLPHPGGAGGDLAVGEGRDRVVIGVEELGVEGDLAPVGRDLEEVVDVGGDLAEADGGRPLGQLRHGLALGLRRLDDDVHVLALRHVQVEVVGGDHVGEGVRRRDELGEVHEAREALLDLEAAALGPHLD